MLSVLVLVLYNLHVIHLRLRKNWAHHCALINCIPVMRQAYLSIHAKSEQPLQSTDV